MSYVHFDASKPDPATRNGTQAWSDVRENMEALRDMVVAGTLVGWNGAASGGTADQPTTVLRSKGVERIRASISYGTSGGADGNPLTVLYEYSSNAGVSYDTIGTLTYTYDAGGDVTAWDWS